MLGGLLTGGFVIEPAAAEPSAARPDAKRASDEDLGQALLSGVLAARPQATVDRITGMLALARDTGERASLLTLRGAGLIGLGKIDAANRDFSEARRLATPDIKVDYLYFFAAISHDRADQASIALDRLLAGPLENLMSVNPEYMHYYLATKKVPKAKLDDQRIGLAKASFGGPDFAFMRLAAVRILMARGRTAEAASLVPTINRVSMVQQALIDRRLEPLWPEFERFAGPKMAALANRVVASAEADFAVDPADFDRRRRLMEAYSAANRNADAIARGTEVGVTPDALAALDEPGGWVVNQHAMSLFREGKRAEADRRFADLIAANSAKPWIVNMTINRLELLTQVGNYTAADALVAYTEANGRSFASPYAKQLIRRMKMCTAVSLKQMAQVPALLAEVQAHAKDAQTATVEGLICAGDVAGAEKLALEGLADEDSRTSIVSQMQKKPLDPDDPSLWSDDWSALRDRPAVEAAFQKAGRDLPDLYRVK